MLPHRFFFWLFGVYAGVYNAFEQTLFQESLKQLCVSNPSSNAVVYDFLRTRFPTTFKTQISRPIKGAGLKLKPCD